ncbi:MAG: tRNA preQ1(34) S-adenosylmethionine ribosyltransferase-isomerase QueA, partial [Planctomycetota bacterium]
MNRLSDYDYELPEELVAQTPAKERHHSRLMVLDRTSETIDHKKFYEISAHLDPGDALVINDTRVIPARIPARRATGGEVEIFLLEAEADGTWKALARPTARLKEGEVLSLHSGGQAGLEAFLGDGCWSVSFHDLPSNRDILDMGRMPLPHYIRRDKNEDPRDDLDRRRYQTIYHEHDGAVAAPTAGLHFTRTLLDELTEKGIRVVSLTLHVGIGTFAPVRDEDFMLHKMHSERFVLSMESAKTLNEARAAGGRIVAVGTTSARVLESVSDESGKFF